MSSSSSMLSLVPKLWAATADVPIDDVPPKVVVLAVCPHRILPVVAGALLVTGVVVRSEALALPPAGA